MGLIVTNLRKVYPATVAGGEGVEVLRGVSMTMEKGETVAVVGPSGSGKSTFLQIVGTLDRPTEGVVRIEAVDVFSLGSKALAKLRSQTIGFVFQDHHLLPQCSAVENVLLARMAMGRVRNEDVDFALGLLSRVGLASRAEHLPGEMSGGERQRVAIARALMNRPKLLLADEPTGNLDGKSADAVTTLLLSVAKEREAMLIAVTHSEKVAGRFGKKMAMKDGELVSG